MSVCNASETAALKAEIVTLGNRLAHVERQLERTEQQLAQRASRSDSIDDDASIALLQHRQKQTRIDVSRTPLLDKE
jgi:hypothetical protein